MLSWIMPLYFPLHHHNFRVCVGGQISRIPLDLDLGSHLSPRRTPGPLLFAFTLNLIHTLSFSLSLSVGFNCLHLTKASLLGNKGKIFKQCFMGM